MRKILPLSQHIISRIAAGEVIERPAYAVKELLENSIDANASEITIHIEEAGLKRIVVIDDGEGMEKEDLLESFRPHTTSKISGDTLSRIITLGFRGEALSSIASVSNLTIASRSEYLTSGIKVVVENGTVIQVSPFGMPPGTSVTVENLFHSMPARKKFLKSTRTEFRHILDIVTSIALSHPEIRITLTHNKRKLLDLPKSNNAVERIKVLLGQSIFQYLLPLLHEDSFLKISGYIGKPQLTTYSLDKHYLFVNKRNVSDKAISTAIRDAYGNLLESTAYPVAVIFIELPHEMIDVNVHPRKEQIAFINARLVYDFVQQAVEKTLTAHNLTFSNIGWRSHDDEYIGKKGNLTSFAGQLLKDIVEPWEVNEKVELEKSEPIQLQNLYIITPTKRGFLFIDQHAAHERILFEQYEKAYKEQKEVVKSITLKKSVPINLSLSDGEVLEENVEIFSQLGFEIEHFRSSTFTVTKVPTLFQDRDIAKIVMEMLDDIREEKGNKAVDRRTYRMLTYLACRNAIMSGMKLSKSECKRLVQKLQKCKSPYTCPHGRPTQIEVSIKELDKMFKRS